MSILLAVFGKKGYAQYRLPVRRNIDYSLWLSERIFLTEDSLRIYLENIEGSWRIRESESYVIIGLQGRKDLQKGGRFDLVSLQGDVYTFHVYDLTDRSYSYDKYHIRSPISIGRGLENDIVIRDHPAISRDHARIFFSGSTWMVESKGVNGIYINDSFLSERGKLDFGDRINIMGVQVVFLADYIAVERAVFDVETRLQPAEIPVYSLSEREVDGDPPADLFPARTPAGQGKGKVRGSSHLTMTLVHRSPRSYREPDEAAIQIDPPPDQDVTEEMPAPLQVLSNTLMTLPMLAGSLYMIYMAQKEGEGQESYMYGSLLIAAVSLLTSLFWVMVQSLYIRKKDRDSWKRSTRSYRAYLQDKKKEIRERSLTIREIYEGRYVDSGSCMNLVRDSGFLWTRMPYHKDFLDCRLGRGTMALPAEVQLPENHFQIRKNELLAEAEQLWKDCRMMSDMPRAISLAEHSQIGILSRSEKARIEIASGIIVQLAFHNCYTETKFALIYDDAGCSSAKDWDAMRWLPHVWDRDGGMRYLASSREEAGRVFYSLMQVIRKREEQGSSRLPVYIIFVAAPAFLEGEPIERYLTKRENPYGIVVVWLASEREMLPGSCEFVIEKNEEFQGCYHMMTGEKEDLVFDRVSPARVDLFARSLSSCRVIENTDNSDIPAEVSFLSLFSADRAQDLKVSDCWRKNRGLDSLRAPVGIKAGNKIQYLDIHEKYHGPHGLVAGTTGSGKSELLQTYILSLSCLYSPEIINLFLIDYKGGGMAALFDGLPHICGRISNLSGRKIARAMTALRSENQRRQKLFREYGVNNISAYMNLYYRDSTMDPVPHLLIVIDEFAELKKEEPDFMAELISVAQVGRSAGLHLILATQKPGGTVDDKIWSNTRFRMCRRVQEKQDSMDMLHKPDAADLSQTGRCCFQVGNDEIYEVFQTGWSGAEYIENEKDRRKCALIRLTGEEEPLPAAPDKADRSPQSQFDAVRDYLICLSEKEGLPGARQLWMEPLPDKLFLSDVRPLSEKGDRTDRHSQRDPAVCIGLADDPARQRQVTVETALYHHTVVCGLPMTGKTTFLQTVIYGTAAGFSPQEIHIYIMDYSNNSLRAFENLPHVGGVISEGEERKCQPFFSMLDRILKERRKIFAGTNYRQYVSRGKSCALPAILLVIDNFSSFNEKTGHRFEDTILKLCKEGENIGISLILSCGGFSSSELPISMADYFKQQYCLEMKEAFSYSEIFGTLTLPLLPEKGVRGRGLTLFEGEILEFQTALALPENDDQKRMDLIREMGREQKRKLQKEMQEWLPVPIPCIPEKPSQEAFFREPGVRQILDGGEDIPVGYYEKTAGIVVLPADKDGVFYISGRKGTGRHGFMHIIIQALKGLKQDHILTEKEEILTFLSGLKDESGEREKKQQRYYILIENLGLFAMPGEEPSSEDLPAVIFDSQAGKGITVFLLLEEGDLLTEAFVMAHSGGGSGKRGVHMGGKLMEDTLFEHGNLSYEEQMADLRPGQGYLFDGQGGIERILIPAGSEVG